MRVVPAAAIVAISLVLVACAGREDDDGAAAAPDQPAAAAPTATAQSGAASNTTGAAAVPTATTVPATAKTTAVATATTEPAATVEAPEPARSGPPAQVRCSSGLPADEQKAELVALASELFAGSTSHDGGLPRLHFPPDARDRRQGGLIVVIEFNGDERETTAEKKATLDQQMRDVYEAFFTAGCEDLAQVDLTARMTAVAARHSGTQPTDHVAVFKTSMNREMADTVDWAAKETLDFNDIWKIVLLNTRWREELKSLEDGG